MKKRTLLSWSCGKDSAWALHQLRQNPEIELEGLFCVTNSKFNRVTMHGVRIELLRLQAESIGLPLHIVEIPYPCSDDKYAEVMSTFVKDAKNAGIACFAFGDLFLEDVRRYREEKLEGTGVEPIFPLWNQPTDELSSQMVESGIKAVLTCLDPAKLPKEFIGHEYNEQFLSSIPVKIDPCGEHGEFHSFVFDGPMFQTPIDVSLGNVVERDGFVFMDVTSS
ncbi:adenine nucleotide alpha hydrolase [Aliifodinibius sp. S!AR15-10]|uniref:Dph6-related ATP pyrophosphatase n=1 Tax=Aliifodinibius sp. S!AR15-10 TaxID=2950437 RepID=UPI0028679194|nr:ATP-binding protein [Aliifodinibius sp. S!AR15-10]MDR8393876.1 adenine nucleotide alpha hydrolase [Aliifodinibius sp. S!AR15-10]